MRENIRQKYGIQKKGDKNGVKPDQSTIEVRQSFKKVITVKSRFYVIVGKHQMQRKIEI